MTIFNIKYHLYIDKTKRIFYMRMLIFFKKIINDINLLKLIVLFILILTNISCIRIIFKKTKQISVVVKGDYFSEKPPDIEAVVFARKVFLFKSGGVIHGFPTFSNDLKEVYWTVLGSGLPPRILYMVQINGVWSEPEIINFNDNYASAAFLAYDGDIMYFQAVREGGYGSVDIWYSERIGIYWGEPVNLSLHVNTRNNESQPSLTEDGTLYYSGYLSGTAYDRGIYRAKLIDGQYSDPEPLPEVINSPYIDYTPYISPDDSFILFSSSRPSMSESELKLYISFHKADDTWSEPVCLNELMGFEGSARFPSLSPDGKYLFFLSDGNIYWVDAKILDIDAD